MGIMQHKRVRLASNIKSRLSVLDARWSCRPRWWAYVWGWVGLRELRFRRVCCRSNDTPVPLAVVDVSRGRKFALDSIAPMEGHKSAALLASIERSLEGAIDICRPRTYEFLLSSGSPTEAMAHDFRPSPSVLRVKFDMLAPLSCRPLGDLARYALFFLVRAAPEEMLCLQNGRFDDPDRSFTSIKGAWESVLRNHADLKVRPLPAPQGSLACRVTLERFTGGAYSGSRSVWGMTLG